MANASFDLEMRIHGVHPDQQEGRRPKAPQGAEVRMPGGGIGTKPTGRR